MDSFYQATTTAESSADTGGESSKLPGLNEDERKKAAELIQRAYRGHRTRRQVNGFGLDAETRWIEAVRDAKYKHTTDPLAPSESQEGSAAKQKWKHVSAVAGRAHQEDTPDADSDDVLTDEAEDSSSEKNLRRTRTEREERKKRKALAQVKRKANAKQMDLPYWLEMVDPKHRYGSSLRKYHKVWQSQDTNQNFFYWLDHGDGREMSLEECSRERLDREQVRYLSREERLQYLVKINPAGKLVWAKNGELVWTKDELYKDSVDGIVGTHDSAPVWRPKNTLTPAQTSSKNMNDPDESDSNSDSSSLSEHADQLDNEETPGYANEDFHRARGPAKLKYFNDKVVINHMIKQSMKKGHKWIFVADTSFRLYIGYKQSGAFQHSSFLHGSRILSAGQIKVKHGQLRRLAPLSGHYRPSTESFRAFVHSLEEGGCDMSHVSISRSYAILLGLEGYMKTQNRIKGTVGKAERGVKKMIDPEKVRSEEEAKQDTSQSAQREREVLEKQRTESEHGNQSHDTDGKGGFRKKLSLMWQKVKE